jgi:hypothetical protein
LLSFDNF